MQRLHRPLQVIFYQDVLCAWCFIADARLEQVRRQLGAAVSWQFRPYPLRITDTLPSPKDVQHWVKEIELAKREPEGQDLSTDLWTSQDLPRSSMPALAALEAAKLQGPELRTALARSLQRAALEQGINVNRPDVVFELASRLGLDMNRFAAAYQSPATGRLILEEHRIAAERGVRGVPTLVIGGRWMLSGLKEVSEYREHLLRCIDKHERSDSGGESRLLH